MKLRFAARRMRKTFGLLKTFFHFSFALFCVKQNKIFHLFLNIVRGHFVHVLPFHSSEIRNLRKKLAALLAQIKCDQIWPDFIWTAIILRVWLLFGQYFGYRVNFLFCINGLILNLKSRYQFTLLNPTLFNQFPMDYGHSILWTSKY